jgi:hypothetical protein
LKAHSSAVTNIKIFSHNEAISFISTSDDMKVCVFSLQKEKDGPLIVQNTGIIDLKSPYVNRDKRFWNFPFNNN